MQATVEAVDDSQSHIVNDYANLLFEQFKDTTFERILLIAYARDYDLAQTILNNALPKGHRHFAVGDVREFIARFNKQLMQVKFFMAKNAIMATGLPALALGDYETALQNLLREFSRSLGVRLLLNSTTEAPADANHTASNAPQAPPPQAVPPPLPQRHELQLSLAQLLVDPFWSVIFSLPVLLGWLGDIPSWPLTGIALSMSVAFAMAHRKRSWPARLLSYGLGNFLHVTAVLPIALWDWGTLHFPVLPYTTELPPWLNASLWGILCTISVHLLANCWLFTRPKPHQGATPGKP